MDVGGQFGRRDRESENSSPKRGSQYASDLAQAVRSVQLGRPTVRCATASVATCSLALHRAGDITVPAPRSVRTAPRPHVTRKFPIEVPRFRSRHRSASSARWRYATSGTLLRRGFAHHPTPLPPLRSPSASTSRVWWLLGGGPSAASAGPGAHLSATTPVTPRAPVVPMPRAPTSIFPLAHNGLGSASHPPLGAMPGGPCAHRGQQQERPASTNGDAALPQGELLRVGNGAGPKLKPAA